MAAATTAGFLRISEAEALKHQRVLVVEGRALDEGFDPVQVDAERLGGLAGFGVLPEEADTSTIGFVIQPGESSVRFAVDYFDITLENSISPANLSITLPAAKVGARAVLDEG